MRREVPWREEVVLKPFKRRKVLSEDVKKPDQVAQGKERGKRTQAQGRRWRRAQLALGRKRSTP
jgi:hypothetical protein